MELTLYTRPNCHLCDKAKAAVGEAAVSTRTPIELDEINVDDDPELKARFTNDVPLLFHGHRELFRHHVDAEQLAGYLRGQRFESSLASETCIPARRGTAPLKGSDLAELMRELGDEWRVVDGHHLEREFKFPDFAGALRFTNAVGAVAEEQNHHPDILLKWGSVRVTMWTHTVDGLTRSDFILAAKIDRI